MWCRQRVGVPISADWGGDDREIRVCPDSMQIREKCESRWEYVQRVSGGKRGASCKGYLAGDLAEGREVVERERKGSDERKTRRRRTGRSEGNSAGGTVN